jgi:hypothetical protein
MRDVAGDVFEIVGPRPADDDGVDGTVQIGQAEIRWVQEDDTGMKLCRSIPVPSERIRAQPAILHYKGFQTTRWGAGGCEGESCLVALNQRWDRKLRPEGLMPPWR